MAELKKAFTLAAAAEGGVVANAWAPPGKLTYDYFNIAIGAYRLNMSRAETIGLVEELATLLTAQPFTEPMTERREAELTEAETEGRLWTVFAALYPGRAYVRVYPGQLTSDSDISAAHADAGAFLGPVFVAGNGPREARSQAISLFTCDHVEVLTIMGGN